MYRTISVVFLYPQVMEVEQELQLSQRTFMSTQLDLVFKYNEINSRKHRTVVRRLGELMYSHIAYYHQVR